MTETTEQSTQRLEAKQIRQAESRLTETTEQSTERIEAQQIRQAQSRRNEQNDEMAQRLLGQQIRQKTLRSKNWSSIQNQAFNYDPAIPYHNIPFIP